MSENIRKYIIIGIVLVILFIIYKFLSRKSKGVEDLDVENLEEVFDESDELEDSVGQVELSVEKPDLKETPDDIIIKDDFALEIIEISDDEGDGVCVLGEVGIGTVSLDQEVEVVGFSDVKLKARIAKIENDQGRLIESARVGEYVRLLLMDVSREDLEVGQILANPDHIVARREIESEISIESEGPSDFKIADESEIVLGFGERNVSTKIKICGDKEDVRPGDRVKTILKVEIPIAVIPGMEFYIELEKDSKIAINIKMV